VTELCVRLSSALSVALGHGEQLGREGGRTGRWKVKETKFVTSAGEKIILSKIIHYKIMYLSLSCLSSLPPDTKDVSHQRAASTRGQDDTPTLLSAPLSFKENTTATDTKLMDLMWGKDKVRQARNVQVRFCL